LPSLPLQLERSSGAPSSGPSKGNVLDGRYLLQDSLGVGGVGTVFRALQLRVKRAVAIKFLHQEMLGDTSLKPRFEHEALALAALAHPNIVRLQDYGVWNGWQYLVMELLDGRTLREILDHEAPLAPSRALSLLRQLMLGLAYAHEQGIVHRDLKPMNVFVQLLPAELEHLKVLDFGFAKFLPGSGLEAGAPVTSAGITFGSPTYISPEQCSGGPLDGRADLYAAGILLFEMLTGAPPFDGTTPELLRQHLTASVPRLVERRPHLAPHTELQALLDRLLAKRREERFANAIEVVRAIDALLADSTSYDAGNAVPRDAPPSRHARAALSAGAFGARELARSGITLWQQRTWPALWRAYTFVRTHLPPLMAAARQRTLAASSALRQHTAAVISALRERISAWRAKR
jgi:serine/threonine-protein kinase